MPHPKLTIVQLRGFCRRPKIQEKNLRGLGLGKIGAKVCVEDTSSMRGMMRAVAHLIEVTDSEGNVLCI